MKKMVNSEVIIGRVYQHSLEEKTVKNENSENFGKSFIGGEVDIAIDEEGVNVIPVYYTYVTEKTRNGKNNSTYKYLKNIMEGKAWLTDGKDEAMRVKLSPSIALNDFYPDVDNDEYVSQVRNEGGFAEIYKEEFPEVNERAKFKVDFLINGVNMVEEDEERGIKESYLQLRGAAFNFRGDLLPMTLVVRNPEGMSYFESLEPSPAEPVFTQVWGRIVNLTEKVKKEDETAFGEKSVTWVERTTKEWCVTGTRTEPYDFGDNNVLTQEEVTEAMQNREVLLAEKKRQKAEWEAKKAAETNTPSNPSGVGGFMNGPAGSGVQNGAFNF